MPFQCDLCDNVLPDEELMKNHMKERHIRHVRENWLICKFCAIYYPNKEELDSHNCFIQTGQCLLCGEIVSVSERVEVKVYSHMRRKHYNIIQS